MNALLNKLRKRRRLDLMKHLQDSRLLTLGCLLAFLVVGWGFAGAQAADLEWQALGEEVYQVQCAACHSPMGEGVRGVFPALSGNDFVTGDPDPVVVTVLHGRNAMPSFATILNDEEIAAVVSHIRTSWVNDADPVTPEEVKDIRAETAEDAAEEVVVELPDDWHEQGEALFASNCAACHQRAGQGIPGVYPPLAGNPFVLGNPQQVIHVILEGRGGMPNFRDSLDDEQVAFVVSFIRTAWENDASLVSPEMVDSVRLAPMEAIPDDPLYRPGAGN